MSTRLTPGGMKQVRHEFRCDRHPRLIFAVLPRVSEKRNDRRDPVRARPAGRIHHDQQLHQMLVRRRACRLNDENIPAANVLLDLDVSFAVRKRADRRLTKRRADALTNPLRQLPIGGAAEDLHFGLERKHDLKGALT